MNLYLYYGPVMKFNTCIRRKWQGATYAVSKEKALSNLKYQFKKENAMSVRTKIDLPGEIELIEKERIDDNQLRLQIQLT